MPQFQFKLNEGVVIQASGEEGVIVGRAEFINSDNRYEVRYMAADGRAVESWWPEDALTVEITIEAPDETDS